jgi:hypothetical protein
MTQRTLIDLVQKHHPEMGETEIRTLLNDAMDEFVEKTGYTASGDDTFSTVSGTMYYDISTQLSDISDEDDLLYIKRIDYNSELINKLRNADELGSYDG